MGWGLRLRTLLTGVMILLACQVGEVLAAAQIKSVRIWRAPDNTRLVFDLSGPVQHSLFTLAPTVSSSTSAAPSWRPSSTVSSSATPRSPRCAPPSARPTTCAWSSTCRRRSPSFVLPPNQQYGNRLVVDLYDQGADLTPDVPATPTPSVPVTPVTPTQPVAKLPLPTKGGTRDIVIAIDAGHGGEDPGALGPGGLHEKNITLSIARELQRQINQVRGYRAELTRTGDYFIPLRKRTEIARKKGADLFVSIHADAAPSRSAFGASVFALSDRGATSETARWLADSENRSDLIGGDGSVSLGDKDQMLAGVLLDLSMTATLSSSLDVGHKVLTNVGRITSLHKRRVEQAGFMVLKSPDIPSILVETGFISNVNESRKLASASHQQALARSITSGIRQYFQQSPPPGTYIASLRAQGKLSMGPREHVVRPGETLAMIAQRYEVSMAALRSSNSLSSDNLKVGQALSIPSTALAAQ